MKTNSARSGKLLVPIVTVLEIYNLRIDEAREQHDDVRFLVFVRNMAT